MSVMLEVYYRAPYDATREENLSSEVRTFGGKLTFREEPDTEVSSAICLTYEFDTRDAALRCEQRLLALNEHVEGPAEYGES